MGIFLSRFKRKKTTLEILESLEDRIKSIEENRLNTEQRRQRIVGRLIVYSVGLYIIAALVFYFLFFPAKFQDQLFYITPLLLFPVLVVLVKRLVTWYYRRKLTLSQEKLHDMRQEKKKLLDEVMDKETYKVAKEILEKFAPEQLRKTSSMVVPAKPGATPDLSLQKRGTTSSVPTNKALLATPHVTGPGITPDSDLRRRSVGPPGPPRPPMPFTGTPAGQPNGQGVMQPRAPGPPMPRPILPRERSYLDKLVEYLVGDGPSNRYALICKQCESHNGMALKEEFEYIGFRCCYCFYWNPARKQRPQAPRLPSPRRSNSLPGQTSTSELESASDSEEESGSDHLSEPELAAKEAEDKSAEIVEDLKENDKPAENDNTAEVVSSNPPES